ncbi:hypothetical protein RD792_017239 [Penstemon davidsonii]|uniref:Uncharacterized protein n=1 Tax=Penstemon davidsonii TaxID=160366 RepID=A0ABR0CME2_9LAMI|nr:hypothetical protein RD792_017239 [Penstemon davidsonii]
MQQNEKLRRQTEMLNQENIALRIEFKQKFAVVVDAASAGSFVTDSVPSTSSSNSKASRYLIVDQKGVGKLINMAIKKGGAAHRNQKPTKCMLIALAPANRVVVPCAGANHIVRAMESSNGTYDSEAEEGDEFSRESSYATYDDEDGEGYIFRRGYATYEGETEESDEGGRESSNATYEGEDDESDENEKLRRQAEMLNQENIALHIEFKQKFAVVVDTAAAECFVTDSVPSTSSSNSKASKTNKKARK